MVSGCRVSGVGCQGTGCSVLSCAVCGCGALRHDRGVAKPSDTRYPIPDTLIDSAARMDTLHHLLASWMQFVLDWGYVGIAIMMAFESTAVPIPAEVVIPPAAFWAAQGKMNVVAVVVAATIGSW